MSIVYGQVNGSKPIGQCGFYAGLLAEQFVGVSNFSINVWENVVADFNEISTWGNQARALEVSWAMILQFTDFADISLQTYFGSAPPRYKQGFFTPTLGEFPLNVEQLNYEYCKSTRFSFSHVLGLSEPGVGSLAVTPQPQPAVLLTGGVVTNFDQYGGLQNPIAATRGNFYFELQRSGIVNINYYLFVLTNSDQSVTFAQLNY